jgi:hypothetical protein
LAIEDEKTGNYLILGSLVRRLVLERQKSFSGGMLVIPDPTSPQEAGEVRFGSSPSAKSVPLNGILWLVFWALCENRGSLVTKEELRRKARLQQRDAVKNAIQHLQTR